MSKYKYYHVDVGVFPVAMKLCFDQKGFYDILRDHDIEVNTKALDEGIAETHYISDGREGIVIMIIDLDECNEDEFYLQGIITHESYHCTCRVFEHIGQEREEIGEEIFAYTIEHIVKQVSKAVSIELEKRDKKDAGKGNRKVSKQKGEGAQRDILQVDIEHNGSARQDSDTQQKDIPGGTKDGNGSRIGAPKVGLQAARRTWTIRSRIAK
jgi:hypothetical protein